MYDVIIYGHWKQKLSKYDLATKSATGGVLLKKSFLKIPQISQESTCVGVFCEIFKKTYFEEHLRTAVSFAIYQWNTYNFLKKYILRTYCYCFIFNSIQDRPFRGCSRMGGRSKKAPLPKIYRIFPTMVKRGTVIPYPKKIQKLYKSGDTPLSSADICIFSPRISNFC